MAAERLNVISGHLTKKFNDNIISEETTSYQPFRYTLSNPRLSLDQRRFYEENGFFVVKQLVPDAYIDRWRQRFLDIIENKVDSSGITKMKDISMKDVPGITAERSVNKLQSFAFDAVLSEHSKLSEILDYVECFTGPNIMAMHTMLINKPPDVGTLSSRHPMHQDLHYFPFRPVDHIVCAWTAMEKIDNDNGCLFVVSGSHKGKLEPHEYPNWEKGVNKMYHGVKGFDHLPKSYLSMDKGDTVFFHPLLLHGSGANLTNRFRKAISCHYAASEDHYIDVTGTTQESIAKEVEEIIHKKGIDTMDYTDVWKYRNRCVRGKEINL